MEFINAAITITLEDRVLILKNTSNLEQACKKPPQITIYKTPLYLKYTRILVKDFQILIYAIIEIL